MKRQILFSCFLIQFCIFPSAVWADEQVTEKSGTTLTTFPVYRAPPFESFSPMVQRPLFLPTRRPASVIKPPTPRLIIPEHAMVTKNINLLLSGVIHDGEEYTALVRKGKQGKLVQLKKDKTIDGWRLLEIKPEEITLNKGANFATLRLRDNKPAIDDKRRAQRTAKIRMEKLRKARMLRQKQKSARRLANKER